MSDPLTAELERMRELRERLVLEAGDDAAAEQVSKFIDTLISLRDREWGEEVQLAGLRAQALSERVLQNPLLQAQARHPPGRQDEEGKGSRPVSRSWMH